MKFEVESNRSLPIVFTCGRIELIDDRRQARKVPWLVLLDEKANRNGFQRLANRENFNCVCLRERSDSRSPARRADYEPLLLKDAQSIANRPATRAHLRCKISLDDALAILERTGENPRADAVADLLYETAICNELRSARLSFARHGLHHVMLEKCAESHGTWSMVNH